jgi:hypothetical protein
MNIDIMNLYGSDYRILIKSIIMSGRMEQYSTKLCFLIGEKVRALTTM